MAAAADPDLVSLVRTLADTSSITYDPLREGITFPLEGPSLTKAEQDLDRIITSLTDKRLRDLPEKFGEHLDRFYAVESSDHLLAIAGKMFDHDLRANYAVAFANADILKRVPDARLRAHEILRPLLHHLQHIQLTSEAIGYLGTHGDKTYLRYFPFSQVEPMLRGVHKQGIRVDTSNINGNLINRELSCRNDWYICINQLIKNSLQHGADGRVPRIDVVPTYRKCKAGHTYIEIRVEDTAYGLAGPKGEPLTKDSIREVFRKYSTTGGGLGGQIIAAHVQLANQLMDTRDAGHYNTDVISKIYGHPFVYYDFATDSSEYGFPAIDSLQLSDRHITPIVPNIRNGSTFRLLLPVDKDYQLL